MSRCIRRAICNVCESVTFTLRGRPMRGCKQRTEIIRPEELQGTPTPQGGQRLFPSGMSVNRMLGLKRAWSPRSRLLARNMWAVADYLTISGTGLVVIHRAIARDPDVATMDVRRQRCYKDWISARVQHCAHGPETGSGNREMLKPLPEIVADHRQFLVQFYWKGSYLRHVSRCTCRCSY